MNWLANFVDCMWRNWQNQYSNSSSLEFFYFFIDIPSLIYWFNQYLVELGILEFVLSSQIPQNSQHSTE